MKKFVVVLCLTACFGCHPQVDPRHVVCWPSQPVFAQVQKDQPGQYLPYFEADVTEAPTFEAWLTEQPASVVSLRLMKGGTIELHPGAATCVVLPVNASTPAPVPPSRADDTEE